MRYVALLRAINVGGHTVKMDRLRALFEQLGLKNVETFIASGNVIFDGTGSSALLEKKIQAHLAKNLGYDVATFLRTPAQLARIATHPEFDGNVYVGFLQKKAAPAALKSLETDVDTFVVRGSEFYWLAATSIGQSKVSGARIEKALGMPTTMRSITTVRKLAGKFGD